MMVDKCSTARCHGGVDIIVLGQPLCWDCWKKKCEKEE